MMVARLAAPCDGLAHAAHPRRPRLGASRRPDVPPAWRRSPDRSTDPPPAAPMSPMRSYDAGTPPHRPRRPCPRAVGDGGRRSRPCSSGSGSWVVGASASRVDTVTVRGTVERVTLDDYQHPPPEGQDVDRRARSGPAPRSLRSARPRRPTGSTVDLTARRSTQGTRTTATGAGDRPRYGAGAGPQAGADVAGVEVVSTRPGARAPLGPASR